MAKLLQFMQTPGRTQSRRTGANNQNALFATTSGSSTRLNVRHCLYAWNKAVASEGFQKQSLNAMRRSAA
jgi:hypothetical protein